MQIDLRLSGTPVSVTLGSAAMANAVIAAKAAALASAATAAGWAEVSQIAASIAQAASMGTEYASIAAGLAATVDGDLFYVSDGGGTATVYRNDAGTEVEVRSIILDVANTGTAALLGKSGGGTVQDAIDATATITHAGTGAVPLPLQTFLRGYPVIPEHFGAVGDGVTDDTAAIQRAVTTGKAVQFDSSKAYNLEGRVTISTNGQRINLNGALLDLIGADAGFTITDGCQGVALGNGLIEGSSMTGGYVLEAHNADRVTVADLIALNTYNFMDIHTANVVQFANTWANAIRGDRGINWVGSGAARSDVLRFFGLNLSFSETPLGDAVGIMWDGNCHTFQPFGLTIVKPKQGVVTQNTAGDASGDYTADPSPAFGMFVNMEIDYPEEVGVDLQRGEDLFFSDTFYCHSSETASGVRVGAQIPPDRVTITGGKITGHSTYGVENEVRIRASNPTIFDNGVADYKNPDLVYTSAPRFEVDAQAYFSANGGQPIINWDENDTDGFNRGTDIRFFQIAGQNRLELSASADAVHVWIGGSLKTLELGAVDSGGSGYRAVRVIN